MADKLASGRGKAAYRRRKAIVEPPNGWIKHVLGFRIQHARFEQGTGRVETRVRGIEFATDGSLCTG